MFSIVAAASETEQNQNALQEIFLKQANIKKFKALANNENMLELMQDPDVARVSQKFKKCVKNVNELMTDSDCLKVIQRIEDGEYKNDAKQFMKDLEEKGIISRFANCPDANV